MAQTYRKAGHKILRGSPALVPLFLWMLAAPSNLVAQTKPVAQNAEDPIVHTVKFLLQQQSTGFSDGRLEGQSERLGDRIGPALLQIFTAKELEDPENIRRFLPLIRNAFQYPKLVPAPYRKPRITLPLLTRLERQATNAELKGEISGVAQFVKQQTRPKP